MIKDPFSDAEKALAEKGEFSNMTTGMSMMPMLRSGRDIVVIKPPSFPLSKYDVPLYRRDGLDKLVLHRIIKKPQNGIYYIRGDNTYYLEEVRQEDIVGVLDGFFRDGRYHNCKTDKKYRLYSHLRTADYPIRNFWKSYLRPALGKIKRALTGKAK